MSLLTFSPATANPGLREAEMIRKLDIMLMVTGLRCRTTADNFQPDYGRFTANHIATLNAASNTLKADYSRRFGPAGASRALDKLSVQMANEYGQGHPWLSCRQLKQVAQSLADMRGAAPLVAAADELLDRAPHQLAWLPR
ncbi:MAG: S-adenosyl-L-homocysteine hydrolase [Novosphingobium sp.]